MDLIRTKTGERWLASQYLDTEEWGLLDFNNHIIVGVGWGLTEAQCRHLADSHNRALDLAQEVDS